MKQTGKRNSGHTESGALRAGWIIRSGLAAILLTGMPALAQIGSPVSPPGFPPPGSPPIAFPHSRSRPADPMLAQIEHRQALARNTQRQKDLVKDTDQLLKLAQQLKVAVDKSNKDTLSIDVIKKADKIQKLAKSISSKMKAD